MASKIIRADKAYLTLNGERIAEIKSVSVKMGDKTITAPGGKEYRVRKAVPKFANTPTLVIGKGKRL